MAEADATPTVRAHVVGITDVGRVREHNEDAFLVFDREAGKPLVPGVTLDTDVKSAILLVVCDGMGGAAAGEVASKMASERVAGMLAAADYATATPDVITTLMDRSVQQANTEIFEKARSDAEKKGMGTTLTAAVVTGGRLFVSQVGDSRAYLLRKGLLNQITKDQSLIGQLIEEGTLTEEEAEKLGGKNIVLQAVGVEETLRVDTKNWELLRGDVVLLCSDGLSGMIKDARMREILTEKGEDLRGAADQLIAEANANGGRDNITVVLGRFDGAALRPPMDMSETGEFETAGATFRAPPPPELPNPMKKVAAWGGVLLAVIAAVFLIFRPTKANVSVAVKPEGAKVRLVDKDGKDVAQLVAGSTPVKIDGLVPGDYRLQVTAEKHFDETQDLPIKEHGVVELAAIWLVPKPGTVTVSAADPNVTATLDCVPSHPKGTPLHEEFRLPTVGEPRTYGNVAPGRVTVTASRPGFRTATIPFDLTPEEKKAVSVPGMAEVLGDLAVSGCAGGHVEVRTASGELLFEGDATDDTWQGKVRAVRVRVRVTWIGFRPFEQEIDVAEGVRAAIAAVKAAEKVPVIVNAPAGSIVVLEQSRGGIWVQVDEAVANDAGVARPRNQAPGRYRARVEGGVPVEVEIVAGDKEGVIRLKGK
ncbi:MAG: Stp1/IreP family PP2C-type Ser/Thr phosphatase [Planctomycetes bacterium]|nr:Stp1/IreP family PP2C-type Ser/Thr phosphatase [Planctomycetota bacterium]